jgi:hypothetical protein
MAKKSKKHKRIERYTDMEIPPCFVNEVSEAREIYENCDRSTLEKECTRLFAYIKVSEAYIDELETKLIKMI